MKKVLSIILILIMCLIIYGCENTKVTFNYNCPGVSNYECNVSDKKLNCTFTMPECKEKEFNGWYDAPSNGNRVNLDKDFEEDTTLYAHWIDNIVDPTPIDPTPIPEPDPVIEEEYKIIFNANGGVGGQMTSFEIKYEETLPRISDENPTREGYIFKGWYDNSDYTKGIKYYDEHGNPVRLFDKKNDLILYAGWEKDTSYEEPEPVEETEYEITFNINGGNGNTPDEINVTYNSKLPNISSSIPTRTGYEFTGWYDNSDYTKGTKYYGTDGNPVRTYNKKSDITLYAGWKIRTYKITYNLNGGSSGQTGSLSVTYNGTLPTISKSRPTRSGYTFKGWYDNADYTKGKQYYNENNVAVRNYDKTSNITLYAGWSKVIVVQTYQVTFNINGGSGTTPGRVNAVLGSAMPSITTTLPTRSGYTFMGWYDNADYTKGTQYYTNKNASARLYDKLNGITLYAGWKINVLSIQYNGNGGTWNSKNTNYYVNSNGTVMSKSTNQVYKKVYNYGTKLESSGLTDYNGSWFSWKKDGYMVKSGKQYLIGSTVVDQTKVYSVNDLAKYGGCDLSKTNCTITAKVNWEKNTYVDYGPCKIVLKSIRVNHSTRKYGICVPEQYNGQKLPMFFFLHGMNGDPNSTFYTDYNVWVSAGFNGAINKWSKYGLKNIPAIMVMPWIQFQDKWNNEYEYKFVNEIYNEVINNYNIDTDNVCLMGSSIGGQGVFTVAARFPTYWKSIVAMSALITKPGAGDKEYFANMPMKGFAEKYNPKTHSETYNYEKKMTTLFEYIEHPNDLRVVPVRHTQVPEYALTMDENGDGISDLVYWAINGGQNP